MWRGLGSWVYVGGFAGALWVLCTLSSSLRGCELRRASGLTATATAAAAVWLPHHQPGVPAITPPGLTPLLPLQEFQAGCPTTAPAGFQAGLTPLLPLQVFQAGCPAIRLMSLSHEHKGRPAPPATPPAPPVVRYRGRLVDGQLYRIIKAHQPLREWGGGEPNQMQTGGGSSSGHSAGRLSRLL